MSIADDIDEGWAWARWLIYRTLVWSIRIGMSPIWVPLAVIGRVSNYRRARRLKNVNR